VIRLTIYSRPGCHLCEVMKDAVERAVRASGLGVSLDEIDISRDPDLEARYGVEIPVLLVDGSKAAKYRVSEWEVRRMLVARAGGAGGAGEAGGAGGENT
jgi:glutaredoxin